MNAAVEMPRFKCHKEVHALKIVRVVTDGLTGDPVREHGGPQLEFDHPYAPITVSWDWIRSHKPQAGGYYVVYADGYASYSPAKAFEDGYTQL